MNEQILTKLVIQSSDKDGWLDRQKFAELIVRECAKVCNDVGVAVFAEDLQNNFGTAQTCKAAIEKHFGVE